MLAAAALATATSDAVAATRHAWPNGDASSESCEAAQRCSLRHSIAVAEAGDDVVVQPGRYQIATSLSWDKAIDVHGAAGSARPLLAVSAGFGARTLSGTTRLRHLSLDVAANAPAPKLGPIPEDATGQVVGDDLSVIGHSATAGALDLEDGALLRNSVVRSDGEGGAALTGGLTTRDDPHRYDLVGVTAIAPGPASSALRVRAECFQAGACRSSQVSVRNSILRGGESDVDASRDALTTLAIDLSHSSYSQVKTSGSPAVTPPDQPGAGNQPVPPVFVDPAAADFHQACTSPTIDAGAADAAQGATDADGAPRVRGPAPDIGAYEFDQRAPVATTTAATSVTGSSAQLNGSIDTGACFTSWFFEWGTSKTYGNRAAPSDAFVSGGAAEPVSTSLTGLTRGTTYHYRLVASNRFGEAAGRDLVFTPGDRFRGVVIRGGKVRVRRGVARVRVKCPRGTAGPCKGKLTLGARKRRRLGRAGFKIAAGKTKAVRVRLSKRARHALGKAKRLKVRASATATNARGTKRSSTARITLLPATRRHRKP